MTKPADLIDTPQFQSLKNNLESSGLINENFKTNSTRHPDFLPPPPSQPPPALRSNPLLNALNGANKNETESEYQHVPDYEYIPVIPPSHLPLSSQESSSSTSKRPPTPPTTSTVPLRKISNLLKEENSNTNVVYKSAEKYTSIEPVEILDSNEKNSENNSNIYYTFSPNTNNSKPTSLVSSTHFRSPSGASTTSNTSFDNRFVNKINIVDPVDTNSYSPVTKKMTCQIEEVKVNESKPSERSANKATLFIKNNNKNLTENSKTNSHYEL
jgi:hypothetical protein